MDKSNFAVFVDLENAGGKESMLRYIIEKVKIRGDILLGKVYGYTDRYSDLRQCLLSNTFTVVPSLRYGKSQKNSLDIQLVIDALEVAYVNPLIDSFCIVSGDSDYVPLVGKLKSMGKFVLGISRSEAASGVFINACNEFLFLENVAKPSKDKSQTSRAGDLSELVQTVRTVLEDRDAEKMYASELKDTLVRLRPDFSERDYGCASFGKLVAKLAGEGSGLSAWTQDSSLMISLSTAVKEGEEKKTLDQSSWIGAFEAALSRFKGEGFDRVNPSILKSTIQAEYPDFDEHTLGFRRFSDMMKRLEKENLLVVEMDDAGTMLLKIC